METEKIVKFIIEELRERDPSLAAVAINPFLVHKIKLLEAENEELKIKLLKLELEGVRKEVAEANRQVSRLKQNDR